MTSKINEYIQESIGKLVEVGYTAQMKFINDGHAIPQIDGLKIGRRRLLYTIYKKHRTFDKSIMVLGNTLALHPHSSDSLEDPLNELVRDGLVTGQGAFGSNRKWKNISGAAPRYTEVKYNKNIDEILFKFHDYMDMVPGELEGQTEPRYLITPVPIALIYGTRGIGMGGSVVNTPAFTYDSLLEAYEKDDYMLLKSTYGLKIDYERSNLKKLWYNGAGKVVLSFDVERVNERSIVIKGDASVFKPDMSKLKSLQKQGHITIEDQSGKNMSILISRNKGSRKISDTQLYKMCLEASKLDGLRATNIIMMSFNGSVSRVGIRTWLELCLNIYKSTFNRWQTEEVIKLQKKINFYKLIPQVTPLLQNNMSTRDIAKELNRNESTIKKVESSPIKLLRRTSFDDDISKIEREMDSIKQAKVEDFIAKGSKILELRG